MNISIDEITETGLHCKGEFPASIFALDPNDSIRALSPARYDLMIYLFEDVVAFSGTLDATFELQCGTCLEFVEFEANFRDWSSELDRDPNMRDFDLSEIIREDFLLALPEPIRCHELIPGRECPHVRFIAEKPSDILERAEESRTDDTWAALDQLGGTQ
ncbi:MAG: hypothetical protein AAF236_06685 [Verrucomicrobiota bacterium]